MKPERSVKFPYRLSCFALIAGIIDLIFTGLRGTTQLVDFMIVGAAILMFALMRTLWQQEKKKKGL